MSSKITLTYFDFPAVAEPIRLALAMTGQPWEDNRISREDFKVLKPTLPYNQLPILEVDGTIVPQSLALLRYAGKIGGLYPADPLQAAFADAAVEAVADVHNPMRDSLHEPDATKKMEMRKDMAENYLPRWLANLEKTLTTAGGKYFAGGKLSIGDIAVVCRLNWLTNGSLDGIPTTLLDGYPLLSALVGSVMAEPRIVAYTASRTK